MKLVIALVLILGLLAWLPAVSAVAEEAKGERFWVYVGTYTGGQGKSKGIYRMELDTATGKLSAPELAGETVDPSFLAIDPTGRFMYAVGEGGKIAGKNEGGVNAFAIDPKTGDLKLLNQQLSGGAGPCHLVVDKAGKNVLAANYGSGSACVLPVREDGKLGEANAVQHKG